MSDKTYATNEVFYSLQGEGIRAGEPSVFVRFAGCNLTCRLDTHGFDCDTEFVSGRKLTAREIVAESRARGGGCRWIVFTGGEPLLQLDAALLEEVRQAGYRVAVETNGTIELSDDVEARIDWIVCSPKVAEHALRLRRCHELRYVRHPGQAIPRPRIVADHHLVSPAWTAAGLPREHLDWCIRLCQENPGWRLSVQLHKLWGIR
jgi:organic radical activating enzyme